MELFIRLSAGEIVLVGDSMWIASYWRQLLDINPLFYIGNLGSHPVPYSVLYSPHIDPTLTKAFDFVIRSFTESGIHDHMIEDTMNLRSSDRRIWDKPREAVNETDPLVLFEFRGIFLVLSIGLIASILTYLIETLNCMIEC